MKNTDLNSDKRQRRSAFVFALASAFFLWTGGALAEPYPTKPVKIVVAYPAGGDTDALARLFAERLSVRLGQPVLVDNRPGATGTIGSSYVFRAPPDGYTLLLAPSAFTTAQLVVKGGSGSSYDVLNGFTPIIETNELPMFLVAGPGAGVKSVGELLIKAKASPMSFASPGSGSSMHILGGMVNKALGVSMTHIPFRGVAPAVTDVVGAHVPLMYMTLGPIAPYVPTGQLVPLAVAQDRRSALAPSVPTFRELGVRGAEVVAWHGLFGPKGLSPEIVNRLNANLNEIIRMPDVRASMALLGALPVGGPPDVLANTNAKDLERFTLLIKELGIQAE